MLNQIDAKKKTERRYFLWTAAFLCLCQSSGWALETGQGTVEVDRAQVSVRFSAGIPEILKMIDAKVDVGVVKAFIKNSAIAYNPGSVEIIALKDRGVPNEILAALLQRGGELRAQRMQSNAAPVPGPYGSEVPYDYGTQPAMPYPETYPYSYGYNEYPYNSYNYIGYPYSYSYDYGYPYWPYWSSLYLGFYPYSGFRHYPYYSRYSRFGHFNHFDGHSRGIQAFGPGHAGFRANNFAGQPWGSAGRNMNFHSFGGGGRTFPTMGHSGGGSWSGMGSVARSGGGFRGGSGGGHVGGGGHAGRGR